MNIIDTITVVQAIALYSLSHSMLFPKLKMFYVKIDLCRHRYRDYLLFMCLLPLEDIRLMRILITYIPHDSAIQDFNRESLFEKAQQMT